MVIKSRIRWAGHVAHMGGMRMHKSFGLKFKQLEGPRCRGEDNIRLDLREIR
jgi:hypothetical protein